MFILNRLFIILSLAVSSLILLAVAPLKTNELPSNSQDTDIHVIFDLNGVLVKTAGETKILGMSKFIKLALVKILRFQSPFSIKKTLKRKLFEFLHSIQSRDAHEVNACDEQGNLLPQILCNYLKGTEKSEDLLKKINETEQKCKRGLELSIIASIARMIFTPQTFVQIQEWVPQAIEFVRELKAFGCKVYILSNWDPESFKIFEQKYPEILGLFDGILISGSLGLIKPDHKVYRALLAKYNIPASRAIFFDDQWINVKAAREAVNIHALVCKQKKGIFGSSTPDIQDLKKHCYHWQNQLDDQAASAIA